MVAQQEAALQALLRAVHCLVHSSTPGRRVGGIPGPPASVEGGGGTPRPVECGPITCSSLICPPPRSACHPLPPSGLLVPTCPALLSLSLRLVTCAPAGPLLLLAERHYSATLLALLDRLDQNTLHAAAAAGATGSSSSRGPEHAFGSSSNPSSSISSPFARLSHTELPPLQAEAACGTASTRGGVMEEEVCDGSPEGLAAALRRSLATALLLLADATAAALPPSCRSSSAALPPASSAGHGGPTSLGRPLPASRSVDLLSSYDDGAGDGPWEAPYGRLLGYCSLLLEGGATLLPHPRPGPTTTSSSSNPQAQASSGSGSRVSGLDLDLDLGHWQPGNGTAFPAASSTSASTPPTASACVFCASALERVLQVLELAAQPAAPAAVRLRLAEGVRVALQVSGAAGGYGGGLVLLFGSVGEGCLGGGRGGTGGGERGGDVLYCTVLEVRPACLAHVDATCC